MEQSSLPADQALRVSTVWRLREAVIAIGLFFASQLVVAVLAVVLGDIPQQELIIPTLAFSMISAAGLVLAWAALRRLSLHDIGLIRLSWAWIGRCAGVGVAALVLRQLLAFAAVTALPELQQGAELLSQSLLPEGRGARVALLLLGGLGAPLGEELLYRGMLYGALRRRWGFWGAALVSSLAFGLFHVIPLQVLTAMLLGLVLCWVYERSGSLWAPVLVHLVNNLLAFGLALVGLAIME